MRKNYVVLAVLFMCFAFFNVEAQQTIEFVIPDNTDSVLEGHLKMGNAGPTGKEIKVNNKYMTLGGVPVIPVMGEMHFSRIPRQQWEDVILKMKANGITIVASYLFWIHHEEIEGQFDWESNKDFRSFVKLCHKHGLYVYPRVGPWCHGEVRNGGLPDWLLTKKDLIARSNDPVYQSYVERYFKELARQLHGLLYKDGGPVIGLQLENEYWKGQNGEAHILWLKELVQQLGIDVPLYTVTGWGYASVPEDEVIPLFGGYPAAPWKNNLSKLEDNTSFLYKKRRNDEAIGNAKLKASGKYFSDHTRYPYFTCEMGVGNQISYHRRPTFSAIDGAAILQASIASGSNLPGYYVFAGGANPVGVYTTMEENRDETSYYNEYPDISYDFNAAIREYGQLNESYFPLKRMHYFLAEFGDLLAPMTSYLLSEQQGSAQFAVRSDGEQAFLFGSNYIKNEKLETRNHVDFNLSIPSGKVAMPSQKINVSDSCLFVWPVNFRMNDAILEYATAQPICKIEQDGITNWFFFANKGIAPEFSFISKTVKKVETTQGNIERSDHKILVKGVKPGLADIVELEDINGKKSRLVTLSNKESLDLWLFEVNGKKQLLLYDQAAYFDGEKLNLFNDDIDYELLAFPELKMKNSRFEKQGKEGLFTKYVFRQKEAEVLVLNAKRQSPMERAKGLIVNVDKVDAKTELFHRIFKKEFSLQNPSEIKTARLVYSSKLPFGININGRWLQFDETNQGEKDITGYLSKGDNQVMVDFDFTTKPAVFRGYLEVTYYNQDQIRIFSDKSWLMYDSYLIPSKYRTLEKGESPSIAKEEFRDSLKTNEWVVDVPYNYLSGLNNAYLKIDYLGDIAECRVGHKLIADNYWDGKSWRVGLKNEQVQLEGTQLVFSVKSPKTRTRVYLEAERPQLSQEAVIRSVSFQPEYKITILLTSE